MLKHSNLYSIVDTTLNNIELETLFHSLVLLVVLEVINFVFALHCSVARLFIKDSKLLYYRCCKLGLIKRSKTITQSHSNFNKLQLQSVGHLEIFETGIHTL